MSRSLRSPAMVCWRAPSHSAAISVFTTSDGFGNTWSRTAIATPRATLESSGGSGAQLELLHWVLPDCPYLWDKVWTFWTRLLEGKRAVLEWWVSRFLVTDPRRYLIIAYWAMAPEACLASPPLMTVMSYSVQETTAFFIWENPATHHLIPSTHWNGGCWFSWCLGVMP